MTISIPNGVFDKYNQVMDMFLANDGFSKPCLIHYPPIKSACTSCTNLAGQTVNTNQWGGPAPSSFNSCNECGGKGYMELETTDTVRLRIYWRSRDWVKLGNIAVPNAACQVIGGINDLVKIYNMEYITLISDEGGKVLEKDYKLSAKPFLHGFGKTRYFVAYLEDA